MSLHSNSAVDTETLTRIPLPAVLADHGYGIQQTDPDALPQKAKHLKADPYWFMLHFG